MATIIQTPSGTWKAIVRRRGWPMAIKTQRTKKEAEKWAIKVEHEMMAGTYVDRAPSERLLVSDALDRYVREVTTEKADSTQVSETRRAAILKRHLGQYSMAALSPHLVAQYRDARKSGEISVGKNPKAGPRAGNTVRLELALLGHLYEVAIREWGIGFIQNPVRYVRKPKVGEHRWRRLPPDEEKALFRELRKHSNPMLYWIASLALETGMRASEIQNLRRHQIDLPRRIVRLQTTKNKQPRDVPLSKNAVEILREALANPVRPIDSDLVFFGEPGKDGIRRRYEFNKVWQEARTRAGIRNYRFHDLRHEAGSRLAEGGMDARKIAEVLGHKDLKMAMVYINLFGANLVSDVDAARARRLVLNPSYA